MENCGCAAKYPPFFFLEGAGRLREQVYFTCGHDVWLEQIRHFRRMLELHWACRHLRQPCILGHRNRNPKNGKRNVRRNRVPDIQRLNRQIARNYLAARQNVKWHVRRDVGSGIELHFGQVGGNNSAEVERGPPPLAVFRG
jgi:hypothetical protein